MSKKLIRLSENGEDNLARIKQKQDFQSDTETVRFCISFTHSKLFPEYVQVLKERNERTPEDRAEKKIENAEALISAKEKKAKEIQQAKVEQGREVCLMLRGEEYQDQHGEPKCRYYSYGWINTKNASVTERTKYLDELTLADADIQYYDDTEKPPKPMPADQVIATLVELGLTDNKGKPL